MLQTIAAFDRIGEENAFAVLARATTLAAQGRDIINLGIGQPDFRTPEHIVEAAVKALRDGPPQAYGPARASRRPGGRVPPTWQWGWGAGGTRRGVRFPPGRSGSFF